MLRRRGDGAEYAMHHCLITPSQVYCSVYVCVSDSLLSVCLSVCLFVRVMSVLVISKTTRPNFSKFLVHVVCFLVRAIRYVLLVLWMTSRFHVMDSMAACRYRSSFMHGRTPLLCNIGCVLTAGAKTGRVLRARGRRQSGVSWDAA